MSLLYFFTAQPSLQKIYSHINPSYQLESVLAFVELFVPLFIIVFPYLSLLLFIGFYPIGMIISILEIFFKDAPLRMAEKTFSIFSNERPILLLFDLFLIEECLKTCANYITGEYIADLLLV